MDLTNNTTTGCCYVQAREQKLSKLYLKQKNTFFKSIFPSNTNILQSSQNKTFGVMFRA